MAETLITDVHGQDYVVMPCQGGFFFAPCHYESNKRFTAFDPKQGAKILTAKPLRPLEKHEREIRKLISVNIRIRVPAPDLGRASNYQTN